MPLHRSRRYRRPGNNSFTVMIGRVSDTIHDLDLADACKARIIQCVHCHEECWISDAARQLLKDGGVPICSFCVHRMEIER